jgi:hypothetical protein
MFQYGFSRVIRCREGHLVFRVKQGPEGNDFNSWRLLPSGRQLNAILFVLFTTWLPVLLCEFLGHSTPYKIARVSRWTVLTFPGRE